MCLWAVHPQRPCLYFSPSFTYLSSVRIGFYYEEFVLVLPETENTLLVAEKVRAAIQAMETPSGKEPIYVTISAGVAPCPLHARDSKTLIGFADQGLYLAKRTGKNHVCLGRK